MPGEQLQLKERGLIVLPGRGPADAAGWFKNKGRG